MGKTRRHKRSMEDSEDMLNSRKKNNRKGSSRKYRESNGQGRKRVQEYLGRFESDGEESEWED